MPYVELKLPQETDKSFIVFKEIGKNFPCPWHYHPEYELVLVVKSTGRRLVGDNIGHFQENDLVLLGPLLPHVWVNDSKYINGKADSLAEAIVIHFKEDFIGQHFLDLPEMAPFKKFLKLSCRGIVIKGKAKMKIISLMKKMTDLNGIQRLAALFSIFDLLSRASEYELLASPGFVKTNSLNSSDRLNKVIEYILQNFDKDITLPDVASEANMGLTTFCNFFKENNRITFVEYLNSVRIGHACKLLTEKDQNVVEVAYECGYNSLANFNRQFKKYKQMTPTEYRSSISQGSA
jgi:AraC-like DNA-binding protein